jgi:hypothetical protein
MSQRISKVAFTVLAVVIILQLAIAADTNALLSAQNVAAEIRKQLPEGWSLTLIDEKGKMGHPHGLEEPLFRIDFVNTNIAVNETNRIYGTNVVSIMHPNLRLHFHPKADRDKTLEIIKQQQVFSWDIPTLFGETRDFMIIGSPAWYNKSNAGADHGEEANQAIEPLLRALRRYIDEHK